MAEQIVPDSQTQEQCNDIERLHGAIGSMDALSQEGFSEISAIAKIALVALEHPEGYRHPENVAQVLRTI
jgi:hypothetical protein